MKAAEGQIKKTSSLTLFDELMSSSSQEYK
jgi:hypothetical protein